MGRLLSPEGLSLSWAFRKAPAYPPCLKTVDTRAQRSRRPRARPPDLCVRSPTSSPRRARRVSASQGDPWPVLLGVRDTAPAAPAPRSRVDPAAPASTPTPSAPSRADFPAEAGGGAVRGEGTASGGGCLRVCEQFRFRREISGDNPGPGWLSSTGNLELGDSCGPGVELLLPVTAPRG